MRSINNREKRLVYLTVIAAAAFWCYGSLIEPRIERGIYLHRQLKRLRQDLDEARLLIEHRDEIETHSETLQKQIGASGGDDKELKLLFEEIGRLNEESDLELLSLRPRKTREMGYYRLLGLEMLAEGTERGVARFLHSLGDSAQLLRVDRLQVSSLRTAGQLRVTFQIVRILSPGGKA